MAGCAGAAWSSAASLDSTAGLAAGASGCVSDGEPRHAARTIVEKKSAADVIRGFLTFLLCGESATVFPMSLDANTIAPTIPDPRYPIGKFQRPAPGPLPEGELAYAIASIAELPSD